MDNIQDSQQWTTYKTVNNRQHIRQSTIDNIQESKNGQHTRQSTMDNIQDSKQWTTYKTVNNRQHTRQ
jgi:hypothetical protein